MAAGTQISDMTVTPTCPAGTYAPVVVLTSATGLDPETSYIFDVGTGLAARPTSAVLAADGGAALIGTSDSITVQAALTARPTSATLAAVGGSALIGFEASGAGAVARTVQEKLRDWVSADDFPTLQAAYDSLPSTGGSVIIPAGYAETLTANLTLSKDHCGFVTMGECAITMGTNSVIVTAGTIGAFIRSMGPLGGGDRNGTGTTGPKWTYSGTGNAFKVGDATVDTEKVFLEGQTIFVSSPGAAAAVGLYCQQMTFSRIWNMLIRGSSTNTSGGLVLDGDGAGSGYCGFNDFTGTCVRSFGKGIRFINECNWNTGTQMDTAGPLTAGSIGFDIQNTAVGNRLDINIATFETGCNFAASANIWSTRVTSYNEANTTDVVFGLGCVRNVFDGVGAYPVVVSDANGNGSTNTTLSGNEANKAFFGNGGYIAFRNAAGLLSRSILVDAADIFYSGLLDRALAAWVIRSAANIWLQMDGTIVQTLGKVAPGTPAGALQSAAGIYAGSGVPNNANGSNGDYYFRSDGTAAGSTAIYHKEAGSWVALTT